MKIRSNFRLDAIILLLPSLFRHIKKKIQTIIMLYFCPGQPESIQQKVARIQSIPMPITNISTINENRIGLWHITEPADELLEKINLSEEERIRYLKFSHDLRKRQWLAYHLVIQELISPLPANLHYDGYDKPFLATGSHHISVSHAGFYAAAVCNRFARAGIDIEQIKDRISRVADRFLNDREREQLGPVVDYDVLYIYWCGKEALYKIHGKPDVDFQNDIYIRSFDYLCNTVGTCQATLYLPGGAKDFMLHYRKTDDYMMVVAS